MMIAGVITEARSTSTYLNSIYTLEMVQQMTCDRGDIHIVLHTSTFHRHRAYRTFMASKSRLLSCVYLKSDVKIELNCDSTLVEHVTVYDVLREYLALVLYLVTDKM